MPPVADTFVSWWEADRNFGTANTLEVYEHLKVALLRFDLTILPTAAEVTSARLTITFGTFVAVQNLQPEFELWDLAHEFIESEATYNVFATRSPWRVRGLGQTLDYFVLPYRSPAILVTAPGQYTVDITDLVRQLRASGKRTVNLVLTADFGATSCAVYSREHPDPAKRPRLDVTFSTTVPVPRAESAFAAHAPVQLDASRSTLPDGSSFGLSYSWTIHRPAYGSNLLPGQPVGNDRVLSFNPGSPGAYLLKLRVTNNVTGEAADTDVLAVLGVREHPRLHLSQSFLNQLQALRIANDPLWTRFYQWVSTRPTYSNLANGVLLSYMFAYATTAEKRFLDWSWDLLRPTLYKNGADRAGGLTNIQELFNNNFHDAGYIGSGLIAAVALFYDWGHRELTLVQRDDVQQWLADAITYNYLFNPYTTYQFNNDHCAMAYALAASGYATLGDHPAALRTLRWFSDHWQSVVSVLDIVGKGGALGEGNAYDTQPAAFSLIRAADAIYHATGEDLFLSHSFFKQRLLFDAFGAYPGTVGGQGTAVPYPGARFIEQASIGGDGRRGYSWHAVNLRPNGLMLSRRFAGTQEAAAWDWVFRQPAVDSMALQSESVADLLYYSPRPVLAKPTTLSHFDPSMGTVYIRSDWDSSDATWLSFWAGPHVISHQHLDQGSFTVFKRRDLAPKTGHIDANVTDPHDLAYYTRTVSANNILVADPTEVFRHFLAGHGCDGSGNGAHIMLPDGSGVVCPPNDGGQRTMSPMGLSALTVDQFQRYRSVFDVARVSFFQDSNGVVSLVADLTNAYNNPRYTTPGNRPKVTTVIRRLVYLRSLDLLLVADTVESTDASFQKKWLLHSLDQLQIPGSGGAVGEGETVFAGVAEARVVVDDTQPSDARQVSADCRSGYAALLLRTIWPRECRYRKIGGREPASVSHPRGYGNPNPSEDHFHRHIKDFWVRDFSEGVLPLHRSVNWFPRYPLEANASAYTPIYGAGYGRWRLEIEPEVAARRDYFLNVLKPTVFSGGSMPTLTRVETPESYGVVVSGGSGGITVLFPKESSGPAQILAGSGDVVSVTVSPANAAVVLSGQQQFVATVEGTTNTAVDWSLSPQVGTISGTGLYTAPGVLASQQTVRVTATSTADRSKSAGAVLTVLPIGMNVRPSLGTGSQGSFTLEYSHSQGQAALGSTGVLIGAAPMANAACYVQYDRVANAFLLRNDGDTAWLAPIVAGASGTVQNSQCALNGSASGAAASGNNLTLTLALTFKPAFAGTKTIFMQAGDNTGQNTGWQTRGTWVVTTGGNQPPTAVFPDASASIQLNRYGASQLYWAGVIPAGNPTAAQNPSGDTFMVARAANGNLWANVFSASSLTWGTWRGGGGITKGTPAVGVPRSGTAWVAARGTNDDFWLTSFTAGGFGTWTWLGGVFTSDPALAACPDGSLYIAGRDSTGGVWHSRYVPGSGFQGWRFAGGIINGKPAVACGSDNAAYIAVRDVWNSLWFARVSGNSLTGWYCGGGITSADPQVASLGGSIGLVILDPYGRVWRSGFTVGTGNNWQLWVYVGGVLQDVSAAGLSGELFFVGRSPSNDIWWWRQSGSQWLGIGHGGLAAGPLSATPR